MISWTPCKPKPKQPRNASRTRSTLGSDRMQERAEAAEAERDHARDALRQIAENIPAYHDEEWHGYIEEAVKRRDIARAALGDKP